MDVPSSAEIDVAHAVPGRLRLQVRALAGNPQRAAWLRHQLLSLPGVVSAKPNLTTGSIVVEYASDLTDRDLILASLRRQTPTATEARARRQPETPPVLAALGERLAHVIAEYLVNRAATALVAAII
jgi:Heavy metal associated domain 2